MYLIFVEIDKPYIIKIIKCIVYFFQCMYKYINLLLLIFYVLIVFAYVLCFISTFC